MTDHSEKIAAEETQCKFMAETAQRDLDKALPALEAALKVRLCPSSLKLDVLTMGWI